MTKRKRGGKRVKEALAPTQLQLGELQPYSVPNTRAVRVLRRFYPHLYTLRGYLRELLPLQAHEHIEYTFRPVGSGSSVHARALERLGDGIVALSEEQGEALMKGTQFAKWAVPDPRELEGVTTAEADERAPLRLRSAGLANFSLNTNVSRITLDREWRLLMNGLGASVFMHILTSTSLYLAVPDTLDNYVQCLGKPLNDLPEVVRPASSTPAPSANTVVSEQPPPPNQAAARATFASTQTLAPKNPALLLAKRTFSRVQSAPNLNPGTATDPLLSVAKAPKSTTAVATPLASTQVKRKLTDITLVRSRVFYARPLKSKQGLTLPGLPKNTSRIVYSRSMRGKPGAVVVGLPLKHVFNRTRTKSGLLRAVRNANSQASTLDVKEVGLDPTLLEQRVRHVLKYIWPREYGLHNAFTSERDWRLTTQPFQEYGHREVEIAARGRVKTPERLKSVRRLIVMMLHRHDKFDYRRALDLACRSRLPSRRLTAADRREIASNMAEASETFERLGEAGEEQDRSLMQHSFTMPTTQAPPEGPGDDTTRISCTPAVPNVIPKRTQPRARFALYTAPPSQVHRYVNVVLRSILPRELLGSMYNFKLLMRSVEDFVRARRYESLNMHQITQGLRITDVDWLMPTNKRAQSQRPTATEMMKRRELLDELLYYIFDSIIIPLLRTTFYVTESAAFRNRVLFYRQDDWSALTAPLLNRLKGTTFEVVPRAQALATISQRQLGYSHIRLLPKETGVRPIVNLRRRSVKLAPVPEKNAKPGATAINNANTRKLGQSINAVLVNTFQVLTHEKNAQPELLGASVFGPNEVYTRIKDFKRSLQQTASLGTGTAQQRKKLYFVKVDVVAAFDTIDQAKLIEIIKRILSREDGYVVQRFVQFMAGPGGKLKRSFIRRACPESEQRTFDDLSAELAAALRHVIFQDAVIYHAEDRTRLLHMLDQHVNENLIKIGKVFYRQRVGIPQGSSLSTMLCCFYLGELERTKLAFLQRPGCMLLRYVDDTLFVTTSRSRAVRFYETMQQGHPDFGCFISEQKSLVNFDLPSAKHDGVFVPRTSSRFFPWCGYLLDTETLAVRADLDRYNSIHMADSLTVETGKRPGQAMLQKAIQSIQLRTHIIFNDTAHNSELVVHQNIYQAFVVVVIKLLAYIKALRVEPAKRGQMLLSVIKKTVAATHRAIVARAMAARVLHPEATCKLRASHSRWLGLHACYAVLALRPAQYVDTTRTLRLELNSKRYRSARAHLKGRAARAFVSASQSIASMQY